MALVGVIAFLVLGRLYFLPAARVRRSLRANRFGKAYQLAVGGGQRHVVRSHLAKRLTLPSESLREPVLELFDHLVNLDRSATDRRNRFVDPEFLGTVREEVDGRSGRCGRRV